MLKANRQINIPVCQLEFRLWKTTFPAEVKDIGDASAPGFHQATLEEDFTDEFVDGLRLWAPIEAFWRCARRKSARAGVNQIVAEEDLRRGSAGSAVLGHVVSTDFDCGGAAPFHMVVTLGFTVYMT